MRLQTYFDRRLTALTAEATAESQRRIAEVLSTKLDPGHLTRPPSAEEMARPRFFPSRIGRQTA